MGVRCRDLNHLEWKWVRTLHRISEIGLKMCETCWINSQSMFFSGCWHANGMPDMIKLLLNYCRWSHIITGVCSNSVIKLQESHSQPAFFSCSMRLFTFSSKLASWLFSVDNVSYSVLFFLTMHNVWLYKYQHGNLCCCFFTTWKYH